jgi:hypothetical protein
MEQSSRLLYPKIHYRVHKSPTLDPTLNQINPVQSPIYAQVSGTVSSFQIYHLKFYMYSSSFHAC